MCIEKKVGETPLGAMEAWRVRTGIPTTVPLAYAGRLDPMASGMLLILVGETCKRQENFHALDKAYTFAVLFGVGSDTSDVLGRLDTTSPKELTRATIEEKLPELTGAITVPYPVFSAKTVRGIPLHTWAVTGRLDEIEIPTATTTIYSLTLIEHTTLSRQEIRDQARQKIDTIPPVTDARKAAGNDFRRVDVRRDWDEFASLGRPSDLFSIATFHCLASSGTYMRSLATLLAEKLHTKGLAWSIHRDSIGTYDPLHHRIQSIIPSAS